MGQLVTKLSHGRECMRLREERTRVAPLADHVGGDRAPVNDLRVRDALEREVRKESRRIGAL